MKKNEVQKKQLGNVHNEIINIGVPDITAMERKLLISCLTHAENQKTEEVRIGISQLRKWVGYKSTSISRLVEDVKSSYKKFIVSWDNEHSSGIGAIFTYFDYDKEAKEFYFKVNKDLTYLFNGLWENGRYTKLLNEYCSLKSKYALIAYEQLRQFRTTGIWRIEFADYKKLMGHKKNMPTKKILSGSVAIIRDELSQIYPDLRVTPIYRRNKLIELVFIIPAESKKAEDKKTRERVLSEYKEDLMVDMKKEDQRYFTCAFYDEHKRLLAVTTTANPYKQYKKLLSTYKGLQDEISLVGIAEGAKKEALEYARMVMSKQLPKYNKPPRYLNWSEEVTRKLETEILLKKEFESKFALYETEEQKKSKVEDAYLKWFGDEQAAKVFLKKRDEYIAAHS